jgi:hypothetical protein
MVLLFAAFVALSSAFAPALPSARRTSPLSAEALTGAAYREKVKSLIYAEDKKELKGPERAAAIKKLKEKIAKLKK